MDSRARKSAASRRAMRPGEAHLELAPQGPAFDFLEATIQAPAPRPGAVSRTALVNRLRAAGGISVTTVVAPCGYGKTTMLAQCAQRDEREFAWVTIDGRDNDPVVLLRHIAAALDRNEPVKHQVVEALRLRSASIWSRAIPRLAAELSARCPTVLVLDDFHLLRSRESLGAVAALIDDTAEGSMIVIAGRTAPRLPLAPLRVQGRLLELGTTDMAMTRRESQLLLRSAGITADEAQGADLYDQCEGWPAALYLASLSIREGREQGIGPNRVVGDDRYLADYFRSEYLSHMRPGPLRFMRRTSILDRMSGSLCDAILRDDGSAAELTKIERANLFVVPLDNRRVWYRYHHLFREFLQRDLLDNEPEFLPVLHSRAAAWYHARGEDESALEHAYAAGDTDRAAAILATIARPGENPGRITTLDDWLHRFDNVALLERYPAVALHGSRIHALRGRASDAARWLDAASRSTFNGPLPDGSTSIAAWVAVLRAWLCRTGAKQMLTDAEAALQGLSERSTWRPDALLAEGVALILLGENERADDALGSAVECAAAVGSADVQAVALGHRALLAADTGDHALADRWSRDVGEIVRSAKVDAYPARALEHVTAARMLLRQGRWNDARAPLAAAQDLLPHLTDALPWLGVRIRLELAGCFFSLRDVDLAGELLGEADTMLRHVRGLASLAARAEQLRKEIEVMPGAAAVHGVALTPAELRLLPLLATHLSFREIAERLYVSRNTIKTQAISVYRKLGVASRSDAIAEAQRLGLDDHLRVVVSNRP